MIDSGTSRRLGIAVAALASLALCMGLPRAAEARKKKRIVVIGFSGPRAASFQRTVTKLVKRRHRVIAGSRYSRKARRMKARRPTKRNVRRVLNRMNADGMLIGVVKRRGPRYLLKVRLRAGAHGRFVTTITVRSRGPKLRGKALRTMRSRLLAAIRRLPRLRGEDEPRVAADGDDDDDDRRVAKRGDDDADDADDDDDDGAGDDDGASATAKKKDTDEPEPSPLTDEEKADLLVRGRGLDVSVGLTATKRTLSFTVSDGLANSPRGYRISNPVAGAYVVAELYPLAFDLKKRSKSRNIGVSAVFDRVIKIQSTLAYTDAATMMRTTADLPTAQQRWGVGVVYRHNFGSKPTSPTVKVSARYNRLQFTIDKTAAPTGVLVDIPNVDYTYIDPGVAIHYPVSAKLAFNLEARFLFVTNTGEMQAADQYGTASMSGYDADVGFEYKIDARMSVRGGGRILGIAYDFDGTGDLVVNRDGDPSTVDVGGALDQYIGGYLTVGYLF